MLKERDLAVLTRNLPKHRLKRGDLGTVVLVHSQGGYEVEFVTLDGQTVGVVSLTPKAVRLVGPGEMVHARRLRRRTA